MSEAHESASTGGVDGRDRRRLASECDGCNYAWDAGCDCDTWSLFGNTGCDCDTQSAYCNWDCDSGCSACPAGQYGAASTSLVARAPLRSRQAAHARVRCRPRAITHQPCGARARAQVRVRRFATPMAPSIRGAPRVRPAWKQSTRPPPARRAPTASAPRARSARPHSTRPPPARVPPTACARRARSARRRTPTWYPIAPRTPTGFVRLSHPRHRRRLHRSCRRNPGRRRRRATPLPTRPT